jgi:hypothetical protein
MPLLPPQYAVGFGAYLWPSAPLPAKLALGPLHKFGGKAVWLAGLATMAVGGWVVWWFWSSMEGGWVRAHGCVGRCFRVLWELWALRDPLGRGSYALQCGCRVQLSDTTDSRADGSMQWMRTS